MNKSFIVVSGVPGSGKSTLGARLALALDLRFLDKDHFLEQLFASKGVGDIEWRRVLSRESDELLQIEAANSEGAVLVSHWRLPGMPANSGTPTQWLSELPGRIVNVHCQCPFEIAADRFIRRQRHPGHLDHTRTPGELRASIYAAAGFVNLPAIPRIEVNTSEAPDLDRLVREIQSIPTQAEPRT